MMMSMIHSRDHLDDVLDQSSPTVAPITSDIAAGIRQLRADSRSSARATARRQNMTRPIIAGLVSLTLIGGAATAAAAAGLWVNPWAASPDAALTFTLPSGAVCEQRIGNVRGLDPSEVAIVQAFYRDTDLQSLISPVAVNDVIKERRAQGQGVFVNDDGTTEPSGYGTDHYSEDQEYWTAVWDIVTSALDEELDRAGVDGISTDLAFSGEANCHGAQW